MEDTFRRLIELGAGEFEHINGSLIAHLDGTRCLLKEWQASEVLQQAGLYHAAYPTAGFDKELFNPEQRQDVAEIIGVEAENIVYHYATCDRVPFYSQFGNTVLPQFVDRHNGKRFAVPRSLLNHLCELSAANEIDIALHDPDFVLQHGKLLLDIFTRMQNFLSTAAQRKVQHVFAPVN